MKYLVDMLGIGRIKKGAGTLASLLSAVVLFYLKSMLGWYLYTLAFMLFLPFAIKLCGEEFKVSGDAQSMVLDEFVGMASVLIFSGKVTIVKVAIGFVIFRILDILKPWPVSYWDQDKTEVSVVADDLLAGVISGVIISFI